MGQRIEGLTPKAKQLAEYRVDNPTLSDLQVSRDIGIDPKTIYKWKKKPEFQEYEHELCLIRFKEAQRIAVRKAYELAEKGNAKMIEYLLTNNGFKLPDEQNINLTGDMEINITDDKT